MNDGDNRLGRVAIIPARGGSKRIPRKNIKLFSGRPVIAHSIEAAHQSGCFDRIIVSTDDKEIASVSQDLGAEVPFLRPPSIADDHVSVLDAIRHALKNISEPGEAPDFACLIYATAPFVRATDIEQAFEVLRTEANASFCLSVATFPAPVQRAFFRTEHNRLQMLDPAQFSTRSQDLPEVFHDAAQFCWGRVEAFLEQKPIFGEKTVPFLIPRYRVQDIDTPEDWTRAERMFAAAVQENSTRS